MSLHKKIRRWAKQQQARNPLMKAGLRLIYRLRAYAEIAMARLYFAFRGAAESDHLPDFICIGAQKCGTSWLDLMLRQHPQLAMPRGRKEVHFFSNGWWKGTRWYLWHFRGSQGRIRGDITPRYSTLPKARVQQMQALCPQAKILLIVRDPVERAWSMAYMDLVKTPKRPLEAVQDQAFEAHFNSQGSRSRGAYADIIRRYRAVFGDDQLQVLFYDDLSADPAAFVTQVLDAIGADPAQMPDSPLLHQRANVGGTAMPTRFAPQLQALYAREYADLRQLLAGQALPSWLAPGAERLDTD